MSKNTFTCHTCGGVGWDNKPFYTHSCAYKMSLYRMNENIELNLKSVSSVDLTG